MSDLSKLFQGRFKILEPYFHDLTWEDFSDLEKNDLITSTELKHRVLMTLFLNTVLDEAFQPKSLDDENLMQWTKEYRRGGVLEYIKNKNSITGNTLDLSNQLLRDGDVPTLVEATSMFSSPKRIILSVNRIWGYSEEIKAFVDGGLIEMLESQKVELLNITSNPIANIDRKDFFEKLNELHFSKLIWIPQKWVETGSWKNIIDPKYVDLVKKVHDEFYKSN